MFSNLGLNSQSPERHKTSSAASSAASLAAQAAAQTFNKNNTKQDVKPKTRKSLTNRRVSTDISTFSSTSSLNLKYKPRTVSRNSYYESPRRSRSRSELRLETNKSDTARENETEASSISFTAATAAALASKKLTAVVDSKPKGMAYLGAQLNDNHRLLRPPSSPVSSVASTSSVANNSPTGVVLKNRSLEHFSVNEPYNPRGIPLESIENRSRSVGVDDKRHSYSKPGKKLLELNNRSLTSLIDQSSDGVPIRNLSRNRSIKNLSPPLYTSKGDFETYHRGSSRDSVGKASIESQLRKDTADNSPILKPPVRRHSYQMENHNLNRQLSNRSKTSISTFGSNDSLNQFKLQKATIPVPIDDVISDSENLKTDLEPASLDLEDPEIDEEEIEGLPRYPSFSSDTKSSPKSSILKRKGKKVLRDLGLGDLAKHHHHHHHKQERYQPDDNPKFLFGHKKPVEFKKTMREPKKSNKFNEDKPWKHHKDSFEVSEAEKKRYQGVWVANRGLYINMMPSKQAEIEQDSNSQSGNSINAVFNGNRVLDINHPSQLVHGYVVRSLWRRSNLSDDLLAKVWNLVDRRHDACLNKNEFVVGLWLVDQCLYGRKLPSVLNDSVWSSLEGIKYNKPRKKLLK